MFLNVSNANERKHLFEQFELLKSNIRRDNIDEKLSKFENLQKNTESYQPIIEQQKKTTLAIQNLVQKPLPTNLTSEVLKKKSSLFDTNFQEINNIFYYGKNILDISNENIIVNDTTFPNTQGFYDLITLKAPENFTQIDADNYKKFLRIIKWSYNRNGNLKSVKLASKNKKVILQRQLIDELKLEKLTQINQNTKVESQTGNAIIIPEDLDTLTNQLELLCGSFHAGNTSVLPHIVGILDYLRSKNHITLNEYNKINGLLYQNE